MIIDVNADRCLYEDKQGNRYEITPEDSHEYDGEPFRVEVSVQLSQVTVKYTDKFYRCSIQEFSHHILESHLDIKGECLRDLKFDAVIHDTDYQLRYHWFIGYEGKTCLLPQNKQ